MRRISSSSVTKSNVQKPLEDEEQGISLMDNTCISDDGVSSQIKLDILDEYQSVCCAAPLQIVQLEGFNSTQPEMLSFKF